MRLTRRQALGSVASLAISASSRPSVARAASAPFEPGRPRALVQVFVRGGLDAVLWTDPKTKKDVAQNVDVPYGEHEIIHADGLSVGPLLGSLKRFLPRLAILNGVVGSTVSHETGEENTVEMRRAFAAPSISGNRHGGYGLVGRLGALRGGDAPLSDVRLNYHFDPPVGRTLICNDDMMSRLARLFEGGQGRLQLDAALRNAAAIASPGARACYEVARALVNRWPNEPLPAPSDKVPRAWSTILRDALFVLRHRLAPCVFIYAPRIGAGFDSHVENLAGQTFSAQDLVSALSHLWGELANQRTIDGVPLADEVGVVVSSELGRFPFINAFNGKDHFPEFPIIMSGPGLRPGQYGQTDQLMAATPISPRTGRPQSSPRDFVPTLDDVGRTIFNWFGVEDTDSIGYVGRRLDFLLT